MTRKTTWTNSDGLVVGFGPNYADRQVSGIATEGVLNTKEARLQITYASTTGSTGAKISIPAGSVVKNVYMKVGTAWAGLTSLAFGDATQTGGWISATQGAVANLTLNAFIQGGGVYVAGGTDTTAARPPKVYATATDLYFTLVGTPTAGTAQVFVEYV
jgi:hypothetical protein